MMRSDTFSFRPMLRRRPWLAVAVGSLAGVFAGVALGGLLWEAFAPSLNAVRESSAVVRWVEGGARAVLLGLAAAALASLVPLWANPDASRARALRRLREIARAERGRAIVEPTTEAGFYRRSSDEELISVYEQIDATRVPGRFEELVVEIRRRALRS